MSLHFSTDEKDAMADAQVDHMMDTCVILRRKVVKEGDPLNIPKGGYAKTVEIPCGFDPNPHREVLHEGEVTLIDAKVRLPKDTVVSGGDRVTVTKRFGDAIATPTTFDIIGAPRQGPSGLVLLLRSATRSKTEITASDDEPQEIPEREITVPNG